MKKTINKFIITLAFLAGSYFLNAQTWQWSSGGTGINLDESMACATDGTGNVFVLGDYSSAVFTLGTQSLSGVGSPYIFLAKYNAAGNVLWLKSASGSSPDPTSVCSDINGNALVAGGFYGTIVFGTNTLTVPPASNEDAFITKYDPNGNVLWAKRAGGNLSLIHI